MAMMLELRNVSKNYGRKTVLNAVSCSLESGVYGLLGPNGAGKTTLMRCIAGLYSYKGHILLGGKETGKNSKLDQIGYLPQKFGMFPELTVNDMMKYICSLKKLDRRKCNEEIDRVLEIVCLTDRKKDPVRKLSGGMLRRLGIAQALLGDPKLILLDEPTVGLDPEERLRFKEIISCLGGGKTVILSTHIVEDVEACCDHVIVIDHGSIIKEGPTEELKNAVGKRVAEVAAGDSADRILLKEKSYMRDGVKYYRVLLKAETEGGLEPTVEDGYLWILKENTK